MAAKLKLKSDIYRDRWQYWFLPTGNILTTSAILLSLVGLKLVERQGHWRCWQICLWLEFDIIIRRSSWEWLTYLLEKIFKLFFCWWVCVLVMISVILLSFLSFAVYCIKYNESFVHWWPSAVDMMLKSSYCYEYY